MKNYDDFSEDNFTPKRMAFSQLSDSKLSEDRSYQNSKISKGSILIAGSPCDIPLVGTEIGPEKIMIDAEKFIFFN